MIGLRGRDQIWQLLVAVGSGAALLVIAGVVVFGGEDGGTATADLTVPGDEAGAEVVAGPSDGADGDGGRSGGLIGDDDGSTSSTEDSRPPISVESTTTTTSTTSTSTSTTAPSTTSTTEPSSTEPPTSEPVTSKPIETVPTTEPPSTRPTTTGPIESLPTTAPEHSISPEDLAEARTRWRATGYDSYAMTVNRICFCPDPGPVQVVVRNGEVVSVTPNPDEREDRDDRDRLDRRGVTVPELFDLIDSAFEADRLNVVFDKATGVPHTIEIDYIRLAVDDELTVTVRDFQPHRTR